MNFWIFWVDVLLIVCYRIYLDVDRDPIRLWFFQRIVAGLIVALVFAAVLSAADEAQTSIIIRCQQMWCWPW